MIINILFLLKYYRVGGVQTVTHVLANKFVADGNNCHVFSLCHKETDIYDNNNISTSTTHCKKTVPLRREYLSLVRC